MEDGAASARLRGKPGQGTQVSGGSGTWFLSTGRTEAAILGQCQPPGQARSISSAFVLLFILWLVLLCDEILRPRRPCGLCSGTSSDGG